MVGDTRILQARWWFIQLEDKGPDRKEGDRPQARADREPMATEPGRAGNNGAIV